MLTDSENIFVKITKKGKLIQFECARSQCKRKWFPRSKRPLQCPNCKHYLKYDNEDEKNGRI